MRKVAKTEEEFNQLIDDYESQNWKIVEETSEKAVLKKKLRGAWIWHILWFILIPILGNILYMIYRRTGDGGEKGVIRLKNEVQTEESHKSAGEDEDTSGN